MLPIKSPKLCFKSVCHVIDPRKKHTRFEYTLELEKLISLNRHMIYAESASPRVRDVSVRSNQHNRQIGTRTKMHTCTHYTQTYMLRRQGPHNAHALGCTDKAKQFIAHLQICVPSHLWIFMLLVNISPNSCNGACANKHLQRESHSFPASHKRKPSRCHSFA